MTLLPIRCLVVVLAVCLGACAGPTRVVLVPAPPPAPAADSIAPRPPEAPTGPDGVYRNPVIGKIYLRAHEDASGRLLGPQVVYQIVEPGGWNVEALEHGEPRAADPRLREGPPTVVDPAAGWMLIPNQGEPSQPAERK